MPDFIVTNPENGKKYKVSGAPDGPSALHAIQAQHSTPEGLSTSGKLSSSEGVTAQPDIPLQDVPLQAVKNIPSSAMRFGSDIAHTVGDIASSFWQGKTPETFKNLGRLGAGGIEKGAEYLAGSQQQGPHEKYFDAAWDGLKDRYGGYENIKKTVANDPIGVLADLSSVFGGGEAALARVPGLARTAEGLGKLSTITNPLTGIGKAAEKVVEHGGPAVAGLMTGKGVAPFKTAIESAEDPAKAAEFRKEMRDPQGKEIVDRVRAALAEMRLQRSADYQRNMATIKGRPEVLPFSPIWDAFNRVSGVKVYKGVDLAPSTANVRADLYKKLSAWERQRPDQFHTAAGFDALKQLVGDTMEKQEFGSPARKIASEVYDGIKKEIVRLDPAYANYMKDYEQASDLIREIEKTLGAGKKTTEDTALRKILSSTRSNVNTNFGRREKLIEELAKYDPKLKAAIGGHVLNPILPGGLAQIPAIGEAGGAMMMGSPKLAAPLVASSPRVMGEAMHGFGRFREYLKQHPELARKLLQSALAARGGGAVPRIDVYRRPETTE